MSNPLPNPVPPLPGPSRRDAAGTRQRLLSAALELFTTVGFTGTTTALLAERTGLAEGTIYRHFRGKEELYNEVHRQAQRWALQLLRAAEGAREQGPAEHLRRLGRGLLDGGAATPALARMYLGPVEERHLDDKSRDATREFREALQQVVASGKSDGVVRTGPAELWAGVWLALVHLALRRVAAGEWTAEHPQAQMTLEAAWDAIALRPGGTPPART